ncbi:Hemerythrin HHE cation binding domain-containing protein [Brevibacterium sp. Mu109]|uniref:hemerythrin domain-containing protein n=1 Tax=Brevibacterium sp. Mu109 TaxID=1255669 RepID=UPI000C426731|nr:hemerythrin domain-containing protein [Brevibacterium sp. Mu109]MDN5896771.1 hemerythrin domain-containing protein [Nocardioides sp.]SMX86696.1 Hemerythrin HHE cation binding domain-containing protein [Brevibacterium sp. Mu109]
MVSLSAALTREHRDIDAGIEAFVADLDRGVVNLEPILTAFEALRRHIYLEEEFLFPPIRQAGLVMPVLVMVREHGTLWQLMDALTELMDDNDPGDVDDVLASTCRELLGQLEQHNSKEEPIVYPHAETDLAEEAAAELADFLQTGSMPDGWVCEAAQ